MYDPGDLGPQLPGKLKPVLDGGRVTAWWWGHEHRCMGFEPHGGVRFPRCLGHGGVPVLQQHAADAPVPAPGEWEMRELLEADDQHWARFGFMIVDLEGDHLNVRYRDDQGRQTHEEQIT